MMLLVLPAQALSEPAAECLNWGANHCQQILFSPLPNMAT